MHLIFIFLAPPIRDTCTHSLFCVRLLSPTWLGIKYFLVHWCWVLTCGLLLVHRIWVKVTVCEFWAYRVLPVVSLCDSTLSWAVYPKLAVGSKRMRYTQEQTELDLWPSQDDPHLEAELPKWTHRSMLQKIDLLWYALLEFCGCWLHSIICGTR